MKKALLIPMEEKKEAQIQQDIELGPRGRFYKMFDLIELSILFSLGGKIKMPDRPNAIVLKKIK
jgi:hypothetical protein